MKRLVCRVGLPFLGAALILFAFVNLTKGQPADKGDKEVYEVLRKVINHGADLFNLERDHAGCYRLYEGSLLTLRPALKDHPELQREIDTGIEEAKKMPSVVDRAFALRKVLGKIREELNPEGKPDVVDIPKPKTKKKPKVDGKKKKPKVDGKKKKPKRDGKKKKPKVDGKKKPKVDNKNPKVDGKKKPNIDNKEPKVDGKKKPNIDNKKPEVNGEKKNPNIDNKKPNVDNKKPKIEDNNPKVDDKKPKVVPPPPASPKEVEDLLKDDPKIEEGLNPKKNAPEPKVQPNKEATESSRLGTILRFPGGIRSRELLILRG